MKAKLSILFSIPYFILAITVISLKLLNLPDLENIFKPLLLLTLILWFGIDQKVNGIKINWIFMLALFFSLLGDVFLMPLFDHFIFGLVFFLISHLLYISVFFKGSKGKIISGFRQSPIFLIGVFSIYVGLLYVLMPAVYKLSSIVLLIAIPVYATVLLLMVLSAFVYSKVHFYHFGRFVMLGGLLFLVSDGVLALNKFAFVVTYSSIWVMGTYTLAQWMLVYGYMNTKTKT
ncbi:MAG: lysoplasmalogenase [Bacteroidales bacterium]|jgi:uncharacterized membrane protein YhhN|nr:lysoplasmalogenase [Bacteroidales bacterium]